MAFVSTYQTWHKKVAIPSPDVFINGIVIGIDRYYKSEKWYFDVSSMNIILDSFPLVIPYL